MSCEDSKTNEIDYEKQILRLCSENQKLREELNERLPSDEYVSHSLHRLKEKLDENHSKIKGIRHSLNSMFDLLKMFMIFSVIFIILRFILSGLKL